MAIRSPILVMLGHVDHGKTTLLDKIRGTAIAEGEPGAITQHISASYIPIDIVKKVCGMTLEKMKTKLTIPGLLWIDCPGHEAFTTLRKRGGSIADIAVLIIDINEGFQPQTDESLNFLKQFKTPFIVAVTKIDRMLGWNPKNDACFLETFANQSQRTQDLLEERVYHIIGQLGEHGFTAERFDRISDFTQQIAVVPVSGITGEGVSDLLMILSGISQKFLKDNLEVAQGVGKGTVLEVKEYPGLGTTIDVILYNGEINKGDYIVVGGKELVISKVRALLKPHALTELRIEKDFEKVDNVTAASGVKIAAPALEKVIAGSPLRAVSNPLMVPKAKEDIQSEISEVEIETDKTGVVLRADTLGSLEALIKTLRETHIPIRKAIVGGITRSDVLELRTIENPIIFAFNVKVSPDVIKLSRDNKIKIFHSNVIYTLLDEHKKWVQDRKKREEESLLKRITRPALIRVLPGYVFRQSKPAVFGVEIMKGIIKTGAHLQKGGQIVGEVREIQSKGENVHRAEAGEKVAISMMDVTIGKEISEGDELTVHLSDEDLLRLEKIRNKLRGDEIELLQELKGASPIE